MDVCEREIDGKWQPETAKDFDPADRRERLRCPDCHNEVWYHKQSVTGARAHFEHTPAGGCGG